MNSNKQSVKECGVNVYWWDGEYDGSCELPKGHLNPFHYDGVTYFDDDNNDRDKEQAQRYKPLENTIDVFHEGKWRIFTPEEVAEILTNSITNNPILALLSRIEEEVIGEDERDYSKDNADEESLKILVATSTACNELKAEQRQSLNKIIEEYKDKEQTDE